MSFFGTTSFGVDFGDGTLKVVKLRRRGRGVRLVRTWRVPYYMNGNPGAAALEALAGLRGHVGSTARVVVAAPTPGLQARTYTVPALEEAQLGDLVHYEIARGLGEAEEHFHVRHHVRKGVVEHHVHALALRRAEVERLRADLAGHSFPYDDMGSPGYAAASFVDYEKPWGRDRVVLAVGEMASELVLLTETGIWERHLPYGLVDEEDSDRLAARFAAEIQAAASFLLPADQPFTPHDLVLTEEGALAARLIGALGRATGLTVERVGALERVHSPWRQDWDGQRPEETLCMARAFGLALSGLGIGRFRCPILGGNPRRDARRRLPLAAVAVAVSALGVLTITEQAVGRVRAIDGTLPDRTLGEITDRAGRNLELSSERALVARRAKDLKALGDARTATFAVRRALAVLDPITDERGSKTLHLAQLWMAPANADHPTTLSLTLHTDPALDAELAGKLERAFRMRFEDVRVRGPEAAPIGDRSRFVVEMSTP